MLGKAAVKLGYDWPQVTIPILVSYRPFLNAVNRRTITFQGERAGLEASATVGATSTCLDVQTPAMATSYLHDFSSVNRVSRCLRLLFLLPFLAANKAHH